MVVNNLSFDPAHPWFAMPGSPAAEWAVEIFTTDNVYGLDPAKTRSTGRGLVASRLQLLGGQRSAAGTATIEVSELEAGLISWIVSARADEPIKAVKLLLRSLPPELTAAGWWAPTTSVARTLRTSPEAPIKLAYPWALHGETWQTPWVCAGDGPAVALSVRDPSVRGKRFYTYRPHWAGGEVTEVICTAAAAQRDTTFQAPPIRLRLCSDAAAVRHDFADHLAWLESTYGLVRWNERRDVPSWADQLDLVLTLHGQHWTGFVFNTFDRMAEIVEEVCTEVRGDRLLVYLPGWEGRYYWQYPTYRPGPDLGGEVAFGRLCETARRLGAHLMPMFGANGANVNHYPGWREAVFRSPSDRYEELINKPDWDNDRAGEDDQVFLNPGEPSFQRHLATEIGSIVDEFGVDGVFLDTSACWFDDPRHSLFDGYRALVDRLHARHPRLLICGEGWYDALLAVFPMNQTWVDMTEPPRLDDLPTRYSRVLGHLKDGAPGVGSTGVHEGGTSGNSRPLKRNGFIPSLAVVDDTFSKHHADVLAFCRAVVRQTK